MTVCEFGSGPVPTRCVRRLVAPLVDGSISHPASSCSCEVRSPAGALVRSFGDPTIFATGVTVGSNGHAIVAAPPSAGSSQLLEYDAAGTLVNAYALAPGPPAAVAPFDVDLAADQCTVFYTAVSTKRIGRFDICRAIALPDLTSSLPGSSWRLRILGDGSVLVADEQSIILLSPTGAVVRTYGAAIGSAWRSIALSNDGTSFWAGGSNGIQHFDLTSGAVLPGGAIPLSPPIVTRSWRTACGSIRALGAGAVDVRPLRPRLGTVPCGSSEVAVTHSAHGSTTTRSKRRAFQ